MAARTAFAGSCTKNVPALVVGNQQSRLRRLNRHCARESRERAAGNARANSGAFRCEANMSRWFTLHPNLKGIPYVLHMAAWAVVPTLGIGLLAHKTSAIDFQDMRMPDWLDVFGSVAFAPLVETALMISIIKLLHRFLEANALAALAMAVLAAVPHGLVLGNAGYFTAWLTVLANLASLFAEVGVRLYGGHTRGL